MLEVDLNMISSSSSTGLGRLFDSSCPLSLHATCRKVKCQKPIIITQLKSDQPLIAYNYSFLNFINFLLKKAWSIFSKRLVGFANEKQSRINRILTGFDMFLKYQSCRGAWPYPALGSLAAVWCSICWSLWLSNLDGHKSHWLSRSFKCVRNIIATSQLNICFSCPDYRFDGTNGTPSTPAFDDKHIRLIGCLIRSQSLVLMQLQKITVTCHQVSSWYHKYRLPGYFGNSALTLKLAPNSDSGAFGQGQGARNSSRLMQSGCGMLPSVHPSIRQCPGLFPMLWADSPKWSMPSVMEHCFAMARCFATFEVKHRGQKRSIYIYTRIYIVIWLNYDDNSKRGSPLSGADLRPPSLAGSDNPPALS